MPTRMQTAMLMLMLLRTLMLKPQQVQTQMLELMQMHMEVKVHMEEVTTITLHMEEATLKDLMFQSLPILMEETTLDSMLLKAVKVASNQVSNPRTATSKDRLQAQGTQSLFQSSHRVQLLLHMAGVRTELLLEPTKEESTSTMMLLSLLTAMEDSTLK